jgi:glycerate 2-kinase
MRVLLAFDKFKDALSAREACAITAETLNACASEWEIDSCPLADGGEGFAEILTTSAQGEFRTVTVTGPRGNPVHARFGLVHAAAIPAAARDSLSLGNEANTRVAIIEMAAASGLALLPPNERDVWLTTTYGTGELIAAATATGAAAIVLGVGGSATNDLGFGALSALGLKFLSEAGAALASTPPAEWSRISRIGGSIARLPPLFIACDVTNPLLGPKGAAAVYGPQKGLAPADLPRLDHEGARLALLLCNHMRQPDTLMDTPGAGAAGGIAFGLMAGVGAQLIPGFEFVSQWLDLEPRIHAADVVITGEGRFDESSLNGKGPGAVATRALELRKPVHVFAGAVTAETIRANLTLHAITPEGMHLAKALPATRSNLAAAVQRTFTTA